MIFGLLTTPEFPPPRFMLYVLVGQDSSVGIAICYGLDGPRIESRPERDFSHMSRPSLGRTQHPVQWVLGHSRRCSGRGVALNTHPPTSAEVKEREELYLYSLSFSLWALVACSRVNFTLFYLQSTFEHRLKPSKDYIDFHVRRPDLNTRAVIYGKLEAITAVRV